MKFLVQLQGFAQLKLQAATGVFLGSLSRRFLEMHRGSHICRLYYQKIGGKSNKDDVGCSCCSCVDCRILVLCWRIAGLCRVVEVQTVWAALLWLSLVPPR